MCIIVQVTYGSVIKLQHERTKFRLHSHEVPYGSGSGQQSVTSFPGVEDGNSFWVSHRTSHGEVLIPSCAEPCLERNF